LQEAVEEGRTLALELPQAMRIVIEPAGPPGDIRDAEATIPRENLQRLIDSWFVRRGVPRFRSHTSGGPWIFTVPLFVAVFTFEVVVLPWLRNDAVRAEVVARLDVGLSDPLLHAVAAGLVILALLVALIPAIPLLPVVLGSREPVELTTRPSLGRPAGRMKTVITMIRWFLTRVAYVLRVLLIVALVFWLERHDAFSGLRWADAGDVLLAVLSAFAAWRLWHDGTTKPTMVALVALVTANVFAPVLPASALQSRLPTWIALALIGVIAALATIEHRRRERGKAAISRDFKRRAAMLVIVLAVLVTVAPYLLLELEMLLRLAAFAAVVMIALRRHPRPRMPSTLSRLATSSLGRLLGLAVLFVLVPPLLVLALEDPLASSEVTALAVAAMNLIGLLAIMAGASLGLHHLVDWISREPFRQIALSGRALLRAGPILLVFVFFFFYTSELWNLAAQLDAEHFWWLVALLVIFGIVVVGFAVWHGIALQNTFGTWDDLRKCAKPLDIPAIDALIALGPVLPDLDKPLSFFEQLNLWTVVMTKWLARMLLVSLVVTAALYALARLSIPSAALGAWQVKLNGQSLEVLQLRVSAFLGAFSALYLVVEAFRDPNLRGTFSDVDDAVRRRLAVRVAYRNVFG
jgi:hypothetical protein